MEFPLTWVLRGPGSVRCWQATVPALTICILSVTARPGKNKMKWSAQHLWKLYRTASKACCWLLKHNYDIVSAKREPLVDPKAQPNVLSAFSNILLAFLSDYLSHGQQLHLASSFFFCHLLEMRYGSIPFFFCVCVYVKGHRSKHLLYFRSNTFTAKC